VGLQAKDTQIFKFVSLQLQRKLEFYIGIAIFHKKKLVYILKTSKNYSCSLPEPEAASYNSGVKECIHHIYFKSMECIHLCNPSQTTAPLPEPLS